MMNNSEGQEAQNVEAENQKYLEISAEPEKQRQREKEKLQAEKQEKQSLAHIRHLESLRFKRCFNGRKTQEEKLEIENELILLQQEYPEFFRKGIRTIFGYLFTLFFLVAVLTINFILTRQPAEYLASQAFPPDSFAITLTTVLLPFVILFFEFGICSQLLSAKMSSSKMSAYPDLYQREIQVWKRLANTIIWVTPVLLLGTSVALYSGEDWPPEFYEIILLIAMGILAFVTDAGVVYGFERYQNAFAFFWFRINHCLREKKLGKCKKLLCQQQHQFLCACRDYQEAISKHNQRFKNQVMVVPINIYFDNADPQQFSLSGKQSNLD